MANYSRGSSSNIIVGAAALFTHNAGPIGLDEDGKITDAEIQHLREKLKMLERVAAEKQQQ